MKFACKLFQWTAHMHTQVLLLHSWELTNPGQKILQHETQERNIDSMKQRKPKHLIYKESNKVKDSVMFMQKQKSLFQIGKNPKETVNLIW